MRKELLVMFLVLPFMALISMLFASCSDDEPGRQDAKFLDDCQIFVHFVKEDGTNAADYVKLEKELIDSTMYSVYLPIEDEGSVLVTFTRESDGFKYEVGKRMVSGPRIELSGSAGWNNYSTPNCYEAFGDVGTLLWIQWADFLVAEPDDPDWHRPEYYDDVYTIGIRCEKIFGKDEEHTIKWFVHINRNRLDAYRCEVDGEDFDFKSDLLYKEYYHDDYKYAPIGPVIIPIKVK